jgi:radical SAM superfamily enzyme YgiQ (UPF0313 family)
MVVEIMKILFILPGIGKKPGERYLRSWLMEPLTIAVLKRLTPPQYETAFFDDRVESIDYDAECDVVAITLETYTARRAYEIADRFRARGKLIVFGGYHATLCPDDAAPHGDVVLVGNAEGVWANMLADIERGDAQPRYQGEASLDYGLPDRSIYADKMKKYQPVSLVEIGRGCRRKCEFCSISAYYGGCYKHRRIEDIVEEIKTCRHKMFFFVDDSIFSDKAFAKELFAEVAKLKITWTTQITLDIAQDEELLRLMRKSGCELVLIGFESVSAENLQQMNKAWSERLGERDEIVGRIHRAGISIYASFVFGFDEDCERTFADVLAFSMRHRFFVTAFNHLLAFPSTPTYSRFEGEGRLLSPRWWMEDGYTYGTISFKPARATPDELTLLCGKYKHKFYTFGSILRRLPALMKRTRSLKIHAAYWYINMLFHFEVDKRIGIPIGKNLDERKK